MRAIGTIHLRLRPSASHEVAGITLDALVRFAEDDVYPAPIGLPTILTPDCNGFGEQRVGSAHPPVMLIPEFTAALVRSWIASCPETLDEIAPLGVALQTEKRLAFFISDNVCHILLKPVYIARAFATCPPADNRLGREQENRGGR